LGSVSNIFASAIALLIAVYFFVEDRAYERHGYAVRAVVTSVKYDTDAGYFSVFTFENEAGEKVTTERAEKLPIGNEYVGVCHRKYQSDCRFDTYDSDLGKTHFLVFAVVALFLSSIALWRDYTWAWHKSLVPGSRGNVLLLKRSLSNALSNVALLIYAEAVFLEIICAPATHFRQYVYVLILAILISIPILAYFFSHILGRAFLELSEKGLRYNEGTGKDFFWTWEEMGGMVLVTFPSRKEGKCSPAEIGEEELLYCWRADARNFIRHRTLLNFHGNATSSLLIGLTQYGFRWKVAEAIRMFSVAMGRGNWLEAPLPPLY
jgi:hypothetical protein